VLVNESSESGGAFSGNSEALPGELLTEALARARERVGQLKARMADLNQALASAHEEEVLLERLLTIHQERAVGRTDVEQKTPPAGEVTAGSAGATALMEQVLAVLAEAGRPLHISELMRLLRERQTPIPGSGTQANVIAHLRRHPEIVRPSRGMYGLSVWGLEEMTPQKKGKRRRVRVRSGRGDGPNKNRAIVEGESE
jgi:hypothetical protein